MLGFVVGKAVGLEVGNCVGSSVGADVGYSVGNTEGDAVVGITGVGASDVGNEVVGLLVGAIH